MTLYAGIDLHSTNQHLAVVAEDGTRVYKCKLPNDPQAVLSALYPFQKQLAALAVESTFNWYWLVDMLMDEGYPVRLANPCAMVQYKGLKYSDDTSDAFWLAEMLRLGILPEGYIYPKEDRPVRDLLRQRSYMVKQRTALMLRLQNIILRSSGVRLGGNKLKQLGGNGQHLQVGESAEENIAIAASKETIDHLSAQIRRLEVAVESRCRGTGSFEQLQTIPGVGRILAMTISKETGPVNRFQNVGNYTSYCRKVPTVWTSNEKRKGSGNRKNGNKYLAWAFSEAAEFAKRYDSKAKAFYGRKAAKKNFMVAHNALSHKLARAAYYIMRDGVCFDSEKLFA
jgi:transposase